MQILIVGGYGNAGSEIARLLLKTTSHRLTVCGRNPQRGKRIIADWDGADRVECIALDVGNYGSMLQVLRRFDLVVVASGTTHLAGEVARAALASDTHYFDIQLPFPEKLASLKYLEPQIEKRGLTFITDGGFHPGMPGLLVRYIREIQPSVASVQIGSLLRVDWKGRSFSDETVLEMIDEFRHFDNRAIIGGIPVKIPYSRPQQFPFSDPFGKMRCSAMWLPEMEHLPPPSDSVSDRGFYITGFNWFTDNIVVPLILLALYVHPSGTHRRAGRLLTWSLARFTKPPFRTELVTRGVYGNDANEAEYVLRLRHANAYFMTAAPVVATLLQFFETSGQRPGLWFQAHYPEPIRFLSDLERLGIEVGSR